MQLDPQALWTALTTRAIVLVGERITKQLGPLTYSPEALFMSCCTSTLDSGAYAESFNGMQLDPQALWTALTTRAIVLVGERIIKQLGPGAAAESRDSLAKNLYSRLFDWIVSAINRKISALGAPDPASQTLVAICGAATVMPGGQGSDVLPCLANLACP